MSDDKTRLIPRGGFQPPEPNSRNDGTEPTRVVTARPEPTGAAMRSAPVAPSPIVDDPEPRTRIYRPSAQPSSGGGLSGGEDATRRSDDFSRDPVVGWVVVVKGPGRGIGLPLGYGMNGIGRSAGERVPLDFGDEQISRKGHATITYDPRGRRFFVQHGGATNLTYIGNDPVLIPTELKGGELISLGDTTLRFVPFCGADFDWQG